MLKTVLVALAMAASSAMAAESDEDYKAEAAIRECASVVRSQGYPWFNAIYDRRYKTVQIYPVLPMIDLPTPFLRIQVKCRSQSTEDAFSRRRTRRRLVRSSSLADCEQKESLLFEAKSTAPRHSQPVAKFSLAPLWGQAGQRNTASQFCIFAP
jgi:hypothetical protein